MGTVKFHSAITALVVFVGCATRPLGDEKNEAATGTRTMLSGAWCGVGFSKTCVEKAIEEAEKDCKREGKVYEYTSHEVSAVQYKCIQMKGKAVGKD